MRAERIKMGSMYSEINCTAFLPFKYTEYITAQLSDIPRQRGCMNVMENTSTSPKYKKLMSG
jgi:hypothetical protein